MVIPLNVGQTSDQFQHPFMIKALGEIRDTRDIPQHNKDNF